MAANNTVITRIKQQAAERARVIAEDLALQINRTAPYDENRHASHKGKRHLAGSFRVKMNGDEAVVVTNKAYWIYIEKGVPSRGMRPNPFVERAVRAINAKYGR